MKMVALVSLFFALAAVGLAADPKNYIVLVGSYTAKESKGINGFRFDMATGKLTSLGLLGEMQNPSFVAIHPNRKFVFAVGEQNKGGIVSAFAIDAATGKLTFLNSVSSKGGGPCFVTVDKTGKFALVANYGTGSVAVLPIGADGKLGEATSSVQHAGKSVDARRQSGPHAHSVNLSPDNRFALVADLGLDQVLVYKFDAARGIITPNDPPFATVDPGNGPRHLSFHPNGKFAYLIQEMGSKMTVFAWDAKAGKLTSLQTLSTLPADFKGNSNCAEVQVHPSGKFVYGSNRVHDSIVLYRVDQKTGKLTYVENTPSGGKTPRNFRIDPTGKYLLTAHQDSGNIAVFKIDAATGKLTATGEDVKSSQAVCLKFY